MLIVRSVPEAISLLTSSTEEALGLLAMDACVILRLLMYSESTPVIEMCFGPGSEMGVIVTVLFTLRPSLTQPGHRSHCDFLHPTAFPQQLQSQLQPPQSQPPQSQSQLQSPQESQQLPQSQQLSQLLKQDQPGSSPHQELEALLQQLLQ